MKVLYENYKPDYASEMVMHTVDGTDKRFKIICENGNCYFRIRIYIQTLNGDFVQIANQDDVNGTEYINYMWTDEERMSYAAGNIAVAKSYIKKVF